MGCVTTRQPALNEALTGARPTVAPSPYDSGMASVLEQVLEWSSTRPMWQRDALRRLVVGEVIDDAAVNIYAGALETGDESSLDPLAASHLGTNGESDPKVTITAISSSQNVNRLAQDDPLTFAETGLTIVYGDNGSGKSGYARILKSVTRTRAVANVRNDIFGEGNPTPTAHIEFSCGDTDFSFQWESGQTGPDEIVRASFFDRDCADTYLSKNTDVAYSPAGLDVFDALDSACNRVRAVLEARVLSVGQRTGGLPDLDDSTAAGVALAAVSASTSDAVLDVECSFSPEQEARLVTAQQTIASVSTGTVSVDADRLKRLAERMGRVRTQIDGIAEVLSLSRQSALIDLRDDAETKAAAAEAARIAALGSSPLDGVGEDRWKVLWGAAREYSTIAYPDRDFPVVDGAVCVLCQQDIGREAAQRLREFDAFVRDNTQQASEAAAAARDEAIRALGSITIGDQQTLDCIDDLSTEYPEAATGIETYIAESAEALTAMKLVASDSSTEPLISFPAAPTSTLETTTSALASRETALRQVSLGDGGDAARAEVAELQARKALASAKEAVFGERDRLHALGALTRAKTLTSTNAISEKAATITGEVLTDVLVDRFSRETDRLGLENVHLRTVGGRHGVLHYRTGFVGAQRDAPLPEVLSEGEQTALGLAGYLAELWTDSSHSAAVFDDPVSSLDHERRDKVAERLVQLAKERQTIVFTHDVAFVLALKKGEFKR